MIYFINAETNDGENADLLVRAKSEGEAILMWQEYFVGWDLPEKPIKVTGIPEHGKSGAIEWSTLRP